MQLTKVMLMMAVAAMMSLLSFVVVPSVQADDKPYTVTKDGHVDANTYKGWKLFRNWCARCHGTYGQGMFGPNLANSLKVLTKDEFVNTVTNGKAGQIGVMPSWKSNKQVMKNIDLIYSYLKARSDGVLGQVQPKKAE